MQALKKTYGKCHHEGCAHPATTEKFCRLHYIMVWKEKDRKLRHSKEKKLNQYINALTKKYPSDYIDVIKKDLSSADKFKKTVEDLEIEKIEDFDLDIDTQEVIKKLKK